MFSASLGSHSGRRDSEVTGNVEKLDKSWGLSPGVRRFAFVDTERSLERLWSFDKIIFTIMMFLSVVSAVVGAKKLEVTRLTQMDVLLS